VTTEIRVSWETTIAKLIAQNLPSYFGQIVEIGGEMIELFIVHRAVMLGEALPILCGAVMHEQEYSGFFVRSRWAHEQDTRPDLYLQPAQRYNRRSRLPT
jgi:hypothetical protein